MFIPRGAYCEEAKFGIFELADEIWNFYFSNHHNTGKKCNIVLPAGTGTTALFLNERLQLRSQEIGISLFNVICVPTVSNGDSLLSSLKKDFNPTYFPHIMETHYRYTFAKPNPSLKSVWCCLKRKDLLLDLIYGPVAWKAIFENVQKLSIDAHIYYIHTGI